MKRSLPTAAPVQRPAHSRRGLVPDRLRGLAGAILYLLGVSGSVSYAASGDLDTTFVPTNVVTEAVHTLAPTASGSVLVGGWLTATNAGAEEIQGLVRLNDDGALDASFGVPGTAAAVSALAIDAEGNIACAGLQTNGLNAVVRGLLPDGSLDPDLDVVVGAAISPWIYALAYQPDGKLLVGGTFTRANGSPRTNLFRLNVDGGLDATFRTNFTSGGGILALALQSNGRILIGGYFTNVLGTVRRGIARLNTDGTLDTTFNPGTGVQGLVKAIRVEADGRILVGGHFYSINGTLRSGLARLSATGTVDATFNAGVGATLAPDDLSLDGPSVDSIVLQGDGRAVVGGNFTGFGGISRRYLARLHWNGDVDEEFDPGDGPDGPVRALALDPDGRLIVAGEFTTIAGVDRPGIARLQNDGTLPVLPSVVTPPESQSVVIGKAATFAVEATGTPALRYQWLKSDLPIADQTNRTLVISASQLSDAGRYSVVIANDAGAITSPSASLTVTPAPVAPTIVSQPTGALVVAGTSVTFEAAASGSKPLVWQWFLGNQPLAGATNESLALDAVTSQNAGSYSARVANGGGSAATSVAPLAVFTPPEDQVAWAGSNATFRVTVAGPGPFGYQWWHEGSPIAGAVKSAYTVTNAQLAIAGEYFVVLSNATSRATSAPALLDVRMKPLVTVPPADTGATNGATVELTVEAIGSEPLSFQWKLHGVDLPDQTNATLTLGPLTSSDAGRYSVVVANAYGSTTSPTATVTVEGPEIARIFVESVESFSGGTLEVPVWLVGVGDENTLAFSLAFDPEVLAFQSISNGLAIGADANVIVNSDAADEGRIGLLVALAPGTTFAAGSNHLATLHLEAVAGLAEATTTPIEFANEPVVPTLLSTAIRPLAVTYEPGTVTLDAGFEGDLSPSPRGDRVLSLEDWSQVALIVAGLAEPADASAFARADCAPVETLGDGVLAAADWTQAGRYAAGIDSPTPTGGPTRRAGSPSLLAEAAVAMDESEDTIASLVAADDVPDTGPSRRLASSRNERRIEAESVRVAPATLASVPVRLSAAGDENTAGFTVVADPTRVRILGARRGEGLDRDSTLILNTNAVARGRLGVLLARPVGARFAAGSHEVIRVDLELLGAQSATLGFADSVVRREVASKDARILATTYASGQLTLEAPATPPVPRLPARTRSGAILMRWDATRPGRYTLETSTDLVRWSVVNEWTVAGPSTLEYQDTHPGLSPGRFYRIR